MLPVAVGLPFLFFNKVGPFDQLKERELTTRWPIFAIAIAHLLAVVHVARRFFVGLNGPYIWFVDPRWTGYGGVPLAGILLGLTVIVTILLVQNRGQADLDQLKN
jgi:protein-S-isoprenylcysteine O-methyltransferase Ste14